MSEIRDIPTIWEDTDKLKEIKAQFAPTLNNSEFNAFISLGQATGLNPFLKEIWAIKYDANRPAQIFIGRDGYRKAAQRQADYDFHYAEAVYSADILVIENGKISHSRTFANRGTLQGAYAIGKRRSSSREVYVTVNLSEFKKTKGVWATMPETMIKKCAEATLLRMLFQEVFAGTYSEEEKWEEINKFEELRSHARTPIPTITVTTITDEQLLEIESLIDRKKLSNERIEKAMLIYGVSNFKELSNTQAQVFISQLKRIGDAA